MVGIKASHSGTQAIAIDLPCQLLIYNSTHPSSIPLWLYSQVEPYDPSNYYTAEKYHQNYFALNPGQGYCRAVVGPKVAKIRSKFFKLLSA